MKTYKFYLNSAYYFLNPINYSKLNVKEKEYNHITALLLSWFCLESYINYVCNSLAQGSRIKEHVKSFLEETELRVDEEGTFQTRKITPSTTRKLLFILQYFSKINIDEFKKKGVWEDLKKFENTRNIIVHHKEKTNFNIALKKAQEMYDLTNNTINYMNSLLFRGK